VSYPPAVEIVYHTPPDRINEDAWLVLHAGPLGEYIVFAAIDGATTRLTPPPLQHHLDALPIRLTPAAFAARIVRDALARQATAGTYNNLRGLLLEANAALGRRLTEIFGDLSLAGMQFPAEVHDRLAADPRQIRLGLPACVVTLAAYDPAERVVHWAHAGDTSLLVAYRDGHTAAPTNPDRVDYDGELKRIAADLRDYHPHMPLSELVQRPEIQQRNLQAGLRHNYVDEHGLPQPSQGVGVLDGLPELRYFVTTGSVPVDDVAFVCAMSDGLEWPASAQEVFSADADEAAALCQERRDFMAQTINQRGLAGYLALLRETETYDADFEQYPRMKQHDDAAGVLLRFDDLMPPTLESLNQDADEHASS
jgi:hypothetical protein